MDVTDNFPMTIPNGAPVISDVVVPHIQGFETPIQRFAQARGWQEAACRPWQGLSPLDQNWVADELGPYSPFQPVLPETSGFFTRDGTFTGVLVTLPQGITVAQLLKTYEDAIKYYQIAYKLVTVPPKGIPGLLFLAPGETGEVVKEIFDPTPPF